MKDQQKTPYTVADRIDPLSRRAFAGLLLQSALAMTAVGQVARQKPPYYTPPSDLAGGWQFTPDPGLPNVLLIGDSISIGYTRDVRRLLAKKANVFRPMTPDGKGPANCGDTIYGLKNIHRWLGTTKWSIIHFNWGLHDLCYRSPQSKLIGHLDKVHGVISVPIPEYRANLTKLVQIIKATNAKPIWASTTVVPPNEAGRFVGDEVKYNRAAAEIMRNFGIQIDDLYALTKTFPPDSFAGPGNVHFKEAGFERIAEQVASTIANDLSPEKPAR